MTQLLSLVIKNYTYNRQCTKNRKAHAVARVWIIVWPYYGKIPTLKDKNAVYAFIKHGRYSH